MSSSVFFKFKSQKEPSRVTFDGTGISVFELKRQIIQINRLGDGSDFDLAIYNQDTNEGKYHNYPINPAESDYMQNTMMILPSFRARRRLLLVVYHPLSLVREPLSGTSMERCRLMLSPTLVVARRILARRFNLRRRKSLLLLRQPRRQEIRKKT